ncbi:hypothetical protein FOA52_007131 [Chlamydomonas sp. UWO 241]|nr:hypothetical protein FOA52_007131 [Chlamydomonas sp. UWO 241]
MPSRLSLPNMKKLVHKLGNDARPAEQSSALWKILSLCGSEWRADVAAAGAQGCTVRDYAYVRMLRTYVRT